MRGKWFKNVLLAGGALSLMVGTALGDEFKLLISDDFNRPYNDTDKSLPTYGSLGQTKEGFEWKRRDINRNGPDLHLPGILKYDGDDKGLIWRTGSRKCDIAYLSDAATKIKDFKLEFDYCRKKSKIFPGGGNINFRMSRAASAVTDGGKNAGYALRFTPIAPNVLKVALISDYGLNASSAEIFWDGRKAHIVLAAEGNHFTVSVNGTPALNVTDKTDNPAKNSAGYFTVNLSQWRPEWHGIDNFKVYVNQSDTK